jgi:hypothetical protein
MRKPPARRSPQWTGNWNWSDHGGRVAELQGGPKRRSGPAEWLVFSVAARSPWSFVRSGNVGEDGSRSRSCSSAWMMPGRSPPSLLGGSGDCALCGAISASVAPRRACSVEAVIVHYAGRSPRLSLPRRACSVEAVIVHYAGRSPRLSLPRRARSVEAVIGVLCSWVTESFAPPSELGGGGCFLGRFGGSAKSSSHRASSVETLGNLKRRRSRRLVRSWRRGILRPSLRCCARTKG